MIAHPMSSEPSMHKKLALLPLYWNLDLRGPRSDRRLRCTYFHKLGTCVRRGND